MTKEIIFYIQVKYGVNLFLTYSTVSRAKVQIQFIVTNVWIYIFVFFLRYKTNECSKTNDLKPVVYDEMCSATMFSVKVDCCNKF